MILASQSPRRLELMQSMGIDPQVMPADIDEAQKVNEKPLALVFDVSAEGPHRVVATLTIDEAYPLARIFSDGLPAWILP